jgi:hypothetical protein
LRGCDGTYYAIAAYHDSNLGCPHIAHFDSERPLDTDLAQNLWIGRGKRRLKVQKLATGRGRTAATTSSATSDIITAATSGVAHNQIGSRGFRPLSRIYAAAT